MAVHLFHLKLAGLRQTSRWPDQEEFAYQVGLSYGGYKKYESGERIPSAEVLEKICLTLKLNEADAEELWAQRDDAKAKQVGISRPFGQGTTVDVDELAKRVQKEVTYILKQAGLKVLPPTQKVMQKRVTIILKNALGS